MSDSQAIRRGWEFCNLLATEIGPRVAGTGQEAAAADAIAGAFADRGLPVRREPFRFVGWEPVGRPHVELRIDGGELISLAISAMPFTGSTPDEGVTGRLEMAGVCELVPGLLEWPRYAVIGPDGNATGFIAVVPEGQTRSFPRPERQLLLDPIAIAGSDEFDPIVKAMEAGTPVEASLFTQGRYVAELRSQNVIAEIHGDGPGVVVISAHYDTVPGTPGAGDNASGVAGCLALAELLSTVRLAKTVRFVTWGAHEFGLLGSQYHAQELAQRRELGEIESVIALDILSDGDRLGVWSGGGTLFDHLSSEGGEHTGSFPTLYFPRGRGETDSWSFAERGIDTVMLLTLPYEHFHLPTDTFENNSEALFIHSVTVARRIVQHLLERPSPSDAH